MSAEAINLLRSIDATLKRMAAQAGTPTGGEDRASDHELDGSRGDPVSRFDPRDWQQDSYKGQPFSACPPDYLDLTARAYDYFAKKNEAAGAVTDRGKPKADFDRQTARLARGWAQRIRSGAVPQAQPAAPQPIAWGNGGFEEVTADDIPF